MAELREYVLHNLSDGRLTPTRAAVAETKVLLSLLAKRFGYDMNDTASLYQFRQSGA